jgi:hypothetical protein
MDDAKNGRMTHTMAHFNQFTENYNTKLPVIVTNAASWVIKTIKELSVEIRREKFPSSSEIEIKLYCNFSCLLS